MAPGKAREMFKQGGSASGDAAGRAIGGGEPGDPGGNRDIEPAELIAAVGKTRGLHGISDGERRRVTTGHDHVDGAIG
ncbi:hypothetical protein [Corynebacterium propinquum]